ncbi:MAG: NAD/NADP octopine/nopaline dehydrogenase family protein [Gemmatimonadetes bacterium]|nr:NAD/NADP octopine/nopaline dehydrogenase family protein [Gemmatimonadota bacterium]NNK64299.1 opine dehydrogenase [Gemmatimonadota bacterium]
MIIAVLGSGNGGCAVAADCALHGHEVRLFDFERFGETVAAIRAAGDAIEATGDVEGRAQLAYAGHDLGVALEGAALVYVVGPSYATAPFADACRGRLQSGQHVVVCPGTNGGAIVFKRVLGLDLADPSVVVSETSTLPYACRLMGENRVHVYLKLQAGLFMASLPSGAVDERAADVAAVYAGVTPYDNVFQTLLQNGNNVIHPAVSLLNVGRIESPEDFLFYEEGVTPGVGRLMEAVDAERLAIAEALDAPILSEPGVGVLQGYMTEENYDTAYSRAPGFKGIVAQTTLEYRYLTEDVGYGLILLTDLARVTGVATPAMDAIITLVSIVLGRDLRAGAERTLETLGLGGLGPEGLRAAVESGH